MLISNIIVTPPNYYGGMMHALALCGSVRPRAYIFNIKKSYIVAEIRAVPAFFPIRFVIFLLMDQ